MVKPLEHVQRLLVLRMHCLVTLSRSQQHRKGICEPIRQLQLLEEKVDSPVDSLSVFKLVFEETRRKHQAQEHAKVL